MSALIQAPSNWRYLYRLRRHGPKLAFQNTGSQDCVTGNNNTRHKAALQQ